MSSNIASRRVPTRTRSTTAKASENGIAGPVVTRASRLAASKDALDDAASAGPSKPAVSTSKAPSVVLGTRKRAALGDLTNANRARSSASGSGLAKDDVSGKGKAVVKEPIRSRSTTSVGVSARSTTAATATATAAGARRVSRVKSDQSAVAMEEERVNDDGRPVRPSRRVGTTSTASASAASRTTAGARRTAVTRSTVPTRAVKPVPELNEAQEIEVYEEPIQDKVEVRESKRIKTEVANRPAKDEGWIDLDAEDMDDPLMVAEYVNDIFDYMKELEIANMPNGNYMSMQRDINWQLRGVLIDWLIDIHAKFRLLPETLFLAVNIIDRFLSQRTITLGKLQLVGVTAMFVAAKYEEVLCPSIENFLYLANGGYTDEEILRAERYMLRILDFNLSYANPMNFLRRISKADNYDIQTRTVAKYFMEISLVDHRLMDHPPSLVAAASVWMARELLERGDWNPTLVHYSTYSEQELLGTAEIMVDYCLRPISHANFHKKYSSKKFMRASTYVVEWARNTFPYAVVSEEEAETQDWNSLRVDLFSQRGLERPDLSPLNSSRGVTPLTECKNDFGTDDEDEASFEDQAGVLRDVTNDLNDRHDSLKEEMY